MAESLPPYKSQVPQLEIPKDGWKSNIPPHLLHNLDEATIWMMEEMSKNSQATDFSCRGVVELSHHMRELNGKTYRNEKANTDVQVDVDSLKTQAAAFSIFAKPLGVFAAMWNVALLRWIFIAGLLLIFGLLYPLYIHHPLPWVKQAIEFFNK